MVTRGAAWLAAAALVAGGYSLPYQRARAVVGDRPDSEIDLYSATLDSYASFPPSNRLWGWTAVPDSVERRLSPGVLASALAVSAALTPTAPWTLAIWRRRPRVGRRVDRQVRLDLPVAAAVPAAVSGIAGAGAVRRPDPVVGRAAGGDWRARTWRALADRWPRAWLPAAATLLLLGGEYASVHPVRALPRRAPPVYRWLGTMPPTVIVHAPLPTLDTLPGAEADYQYFAQYHRHRLLNGNSGFYPPNYTLTLSRTEAFPDRRSIAELRRVGAEYLLVHAQYFPKPEAFADAVLSLESSTDLTPVMTSHDHGGMVRVYRFVPVPAPQP